MNVPEAIRSDAARLLREGSVRLVVGYRARHGRRIPFFLADGDRAGELVYDEECRQNLAACLAKPEVRQFFPVAIVARPEVIRSLLLLHAESQVPPDAVVVLAVARQQYHGVLDLPAAAQLLKDACPDPPGDDALLQKAKEIAAMPPEQRAAFWNEVFAKCTRCYACRAACPGCYCQRCVANKNLPQWISAVVSAHGNYAWNVMRAFHQAGRCTLCGACQAACPQGLPLMLLNVWIEQYVREEFAFQPGAGDGKPLIGSWSPEDDEDFIR